VAPAREEVHPSGVMHIKSTLLILSLGCMFAGGCTKSNPDTTPPDTAATATPPPADPTPASDPATDPITDAAVPTHANTDAPPPAAEAPQLSDAEIAAIVRAVNSGELDQAKLAKSKAKNKEVKEFAAMMVKDHTAMLKSGDAVFKKAALEPKENEISAHMTDEGRVTFDKLNTTAKGAEFDRAYIDAQVTAHTQVLEAIDTKLLPSVQNADLKTELESARPKIEAHLGQAKDIQARLAPATPPTT
jgi:putative membrane protein